MTRDRDVKREVRARMRATGERYTQARSALFGSSSGTPSTGSRPDAEGGVMVDRELLESLDRDGYAVVRNLVNIDALNEVRRWVDELVDADIQARMRDAQTRREAGDTDARAFPLGFEGKVGFLLDDDDRIVALVEGVAEVARAIGTPLRRGSGVSSCLPGWGGHSGLHQDLPGPAPEIGSWDGAIFTFPLSGSDGMRLVPGSHRRDPIFREAYAGAVAPHPDEVHVDAGPGDVVINSIHIWKSGTLNRSTERRTSLWVSFNDSAASEERVRAYWATAEIFHGGAPLDLGEAL